MNIDCPHCKQPLQVPNPAEYNASQRHGQFVSVTLCCNKAVTLRRVISVRIEAYDGPRKQDDWGIPFDAKA